ncbi:hypothetical protein GQ457_16G013600 [Hibiscus cannabinus]
MSERPYECVNSLVAHLLDCPNREWKNDKLRTLFSNEEVEEIKLIPIGGPNTKDELVWASTKDGNYSVKSGYKAVLEENYPSTTPTTSNDPRSDKKLWRCIWNLKVTPKVRNFIWKACHNAIASYENLFSRHIHISRVCGRCGEGNESLEHILFFCPFAQAVWRMSGFSYCPRMEGFPGFCKWFYSIREVCLSQNYEEGLCQLSFLCWHLWKARNKWIFSGIKEEPIDVWKASDCAFLEFSSVVRLNPSSHSSRPPNEGTWTPPPNEWIKANCDALWISCSQIAGIASVFRNESGSIVGGSSRRGCFSPVSIAEAEAVRSCLIYAKSNDFMKIFVESDNKSLIHRLNNRSFSDWKSASIERDICSLIPFLRVLSFLL